MKIKLSLAIVAPIDVVFDLFTNLDTIGENITGIKSIEVLEGPAKMQKGTKWKETRVMFGKEATETMTITQLEPNKMYTAIAASHGMEYVTTYTFGGDGDKTVVDMEFSGKPISLAAKLFTPVGLLFKGVAAKALKKDMMELKDVAENRS